jgi:predicted Zn-dependent peptidase
VLAASYRAYYRPATWLLVVVGAMDAARIESQDRAQSRAAGDGARRTETSRGASRSPSCSRRRGSPRRWCGAAQARHRLQGPRDRGTGLENRAARDHHADPARPGWFGSSSANHDELYADGLIDDSFGASYSAEDDFGYSIIGSDTDNPERWPRACSRFIESTRRSESRPRISRRTQNKYLGKFVRLFNSLEGSASAFMACHFPRLLSLRRGALIDGITIEDVTRRLQEHLHEPTRALSIIYPKTAAD